MSQLLAIKDDTGNPKHTVIRRSYKELIVDGVAGMATTFVKLLVNIEQY